MSTSRPVVEKIPVEAYKIRPPRLGSWAIIIIHEPVSPHTGTMQIHSDYGDWAYTWHDHGCASFKHFIIDLAKDKDYLVGKLTDGRREFDYLASCEALKGMLDSAVEHDGLYEATKTAFLEAYDEQASYFSSSDEEDFAAGIEDAIKDLRIDPDLSPEQVQKVSDLFWDGPPCRLSLPSGCVQFFEKIFVPHFVPAIQAELEKKS